MSVKMKADAHMSSSSGVSWVWEQSLTYIRHSSALSWPTWNWIL